MDSIPQTTQNVNPELAQQAEKPGQTGISPAITQPPAGTLLAEAYDLARRIGACGQKGLSEALGVRKLGGDFNETDFLIGYIDVYLAALNGVPHGPAYLPATVDSHARRLSLVERMQAYHNGLNDAKARTQTAQSVNPETGIPQAASQPVDPLVADIRAKGAGQTDAGTEYQIKTLPDGKKYVQADRQVNFGNDPESWSRQLEDYINGKIRRGEDVQLVAADGDVLTLTADTAGKVSSQFRGDGTKLSTAEFERKVDAGAHIDELAEVSTSTKKGAKDEGGVHGDFTKNGWNYRTAFFRDFDGEYYRVTISAAMNDDGAIVYNIGKMRKRDFPNYTGSSAKGGAQGVEEVPMGEFPTVDGSSAKGGAQSGEKASLKGSIAQPGGEVKSKAGISQTAVQGQTASQPVDPLIADIRSRGAGQTDTDATANFAKVAGTEKGLVYDDYVKNELAKETADRINALAKRLNLRVRFVDNIANGVADGQIVDADIQIAKDAQNPEMVVLGHEVGHWLERTAPKEYQTIQQFVSQRQQAEIDYRIAEYETLVGKELDYDAAQREFVNDYIGEMIADPEVLDKFINENRENRTLLQKVADALRALWQKLTGRERQQVKTAEDALLAALRESEKQTTALEKAGQTMDFATETAEAGAEYSIRFDEKGAIAVLEGKFDSGRKAVYSYLQGLVSKDAFAMVLADAQKVYIGKDLPGEYTRSESTKALFERIRKDKFRASHILNDMLLIGENARWAEDKDGKHGKAAKNGWYYYTTRFATPVFNQDGSVRHYNRYSAQLVVRNDADGKSYLYDVTNIQRESSGIAADGFAEPTIVTRAPSDENSVP